MIKEYTRYLNKQALFSPLIKAEPNPQLELVVIIPTYNEYEILDTLNSLKQCEPPQRPTEVLVLINDSEISTNKVQLQNKETLAEVNEWSEKQNTTNLSFHCIYVPKLPKKHSGAGLARKIAMDEAICRFAQVNNKGGIIASLDADTLVSKNYLAHLQKSFTNNTKLNCVLFSFEHRIPSKLPEQHKHAIIKYELYLRYFKTALKYTGFPYAFHTIGSCFAVSALSYCKQGGMNRHQAGEDFYFLHKIFPLGRTKELKHIKVYPSARTSNRVPFGTGPAIEKIINDGDFLCYQPHIFDVLKVFFEKTNNLFKASNKQLNNFYLDLPIEIQYYISQPDFAQTISQINNNCASLQSFQKRFLTWFSAFKIIKFINFTHENQLSKVPVYEAALAFYNKLKQTECIYSNIELLDAYRKLEEE